MPTTDSKRLAGIALEHGVEIGDVVPLTKEQRLVRLQEILCRKNVPYPIGPATARDYYAQSESGVSFGIGSLSGQTVDLRQYRNTQVYEELTEEDHVSWACLVSDQQVSKSRFACREYLMGEELFEIGGNVIPDYYHLNARIYQQTGWQLATVNEIIPAEVFFHCHSRKFFSSHDLYAPSGHGLFGGTRHWARCGWPRGHVYNSSGGSSDEQSRAGQRSHSLRKGTEIKKTSSASKRNCVWKRKPRSSCFMREGCTGLP